MEFINQMEPWYGDEEIAAVTEYMKSGGWLMEFKKTREFEQMICEYTGAKYCSVVSNGTVSLFVALKAIGVGEGDEVIVPDYTMIATPNAVVLAGATPVFVDIDDQTCLDLKEVEKAITAKTKAVIHVSINGRAGQLDQLKKTCDQKSIVLIEDAAQSLGSFYRGRHLGTIGQIGSFSFSVPKIITTGQGGALVTNDEALYQKICKIKDFGRIGGGIDIHDEFGWNFKFTDLQAVFGMEQMKKLPARVKRKKEIAERYKDGLKDVKEVTFIAENLTEVAPWFIEISIDEPEKLRDFLKSKNIGTRVIYPAIHTQKIYENIKGKFPKAVSYAAHGLWLPSASQLDNSSITYICDNIKEYYKK